MRRLVAVLALCLPGPSLSLVILGHPRVALVSQGSMAAGVVLGAGLYRFGFAGPWVVYATVLGLCVPVVGSVLATFILPVRRAHPWQSWWGYLVGTALVYAPLPIILAVRRWLVEPFTIASTSGAPSLLRGDTVLCRKTTLFGSFGVGDLVVFSYRDDPAAMVSRVAALGGQTVQVLANRLVVDGAEVHRTPTGLTEPASGPDCAPIQADAWTETRDGREYVVLTAKPGQWTMDDWGPATVPEGSVFVVSDNRDHAVDSRIRGWVQTEDVRGVVHDRGWVSVDPCTNALRPDRLGAPP